MNVIVQMPYAHEACTLLRCCGAECRVTYLTRILPPRQVHDFMLKFDKILRTGFERIIGTTLSEKWWRLAQLTPKFGGMSMRSGLTTYGAQHLVSLAKSAAEVERIVGKYDVLQLAKRETQSWLNHECSDGFFEHQNRPNRSDVMSSQSGVVTNEARKNVFFQLTRFRNTTNRAWNGQKNCHTQGY